MVWATKFSVNAPIYWKSLLWTISESLIPARCINPTCQSMTYTCLLINMLLLFGSIYGGLLLFCLIFGLICLKILMLQRYCKKNEITKYCKIILGLQTAFPALWFCNMLFISTVNFAQAWFQANLGFFIGQIWQVGLTIQRQKDII